MSKYKLTKDPFPQRTHYNHPKLIGYLHKVTVPSDPPFLGPVPSPPPPSPAATAAATFGTRRGAGSRPPEALWAQRAVGIKEVLLDKSRGSDW